MDLSEKKKIHSCLREISHHPNIMRVGDNVLEIPIQKCIKKLSLLLQRRVASLFFFEGSHVSAR